MFDLLPNLFASLISILLPIFASYKALRSTDPALLTPWLMYWISFSLVTLVESHLWFITFFIPFYAYLRIVVLLYLVLPQTQGARIIYQTYVHPFLAHHEARIEVAIGEAHEYLRGFGLDRVEWVIELIKERLLGLQNPEPRREQMARGGDAQGYAQNLLARFSLPSASAGLAAPAGDFYGMLSAAASTLGGASSASKNPASAIDELTRGNGLVPSHITSPSDRARFLGTQKEKLRILLNALDVESEKADQDVDSALAYGSTGEMPRSKSEASFERIDRAENVEEEHRIKDREGGGWMGWAFGGAKDKGDGGMSSAVDRSG